MAGSLGGFSVDVMANIARFESDLGRANRIAEREAANIARTFSNVANALGASLSVGAFVGWIKNATDSMDRLDESAQRVGTSAKNLSTLEYAAKRGAVEADVFEKGLIKLAKSAADTASGTGTAAKGFEHLGISVKNADGTLKSTDQLLKETATQFAKYEDSAQKTAVAVNIFGKSGADLIPLLNLGAAGIEELQERARDLGLEISNETAAAAGRFNDAFDDLRALVRGVGNDIATEALPHLIKLSEAFVDAGIKARESGAGYSWVGETITELGSYFAQAKREVEVLTNAIAASVDTVGGAGDILNGLLANLTYAGKAVAEYASGNFKQAAEDARLAGVALSEGWEKGTVRIAAAWVSASAGIDDANRDLAASLDTINAPLDKTTERAAQFKNVISGVGEYVAQTKKEMKTFADETDKAAKSKDRAAAAAKKLKEEQRVLAAALNEAYRAMDRLDGIASDYARENDRLRGELTGLTPAQIELNEALEDARAAFLGAMAAADPSALVKYQAAVEQINKNATLKEMVESQRTNLQASQRAAEESSRAWMSLYEGIASAASQFLTGQIRSWKDFGRALVDTVKQFVAQVIERWLMMQLFTGGGNVSFAASIGGGTATGSLVQAGASALTGGGGGGMGSLFSPTNWASAGRNLYQGFSSVMYGSGQTSALGSAMGVSNFGPGMSSATWTPTGAGLYAGYAAGLGGLYYGATQRGSGGVSSAAAGLSYGALGLGAAGAVGGIAGGAGAVAGATGAFASLGAAAWIPVVGWILAAAALVDMFSGGKLFGTKFSTKSATQTLGLGEAGGLASVTLHQERQAALFGGIRRRDKEGEVSPELQRAADQFYSAISKSMAEAARAIAIDTPPMIDAALRTVTEYTKKGKVKSTKYFVDALGRTWEEETAELAATRINAEAIIATVGASELGRAASAIAERWRDDAELLAAGAQFLVQATADLTRGNGLWDAATLTQTVDLTEELMSGQEDLAAAYRRIATDAANLTQALDMMGAHLKIGGEAFVRFAVDIEQAAGGLDAANALWQSFFTNYYSQQEMAARQLEQSWAAADAALVGIGVSVGTSMDDLRTRFESGIGSMTAAQIVQWLQAADALAAATNAQRAYNQALAQAALDYISLVAQIEGELGESFGLKAAQAQVRLWEQQTIDQLNALARAAGLEAAAVQDITTVHRVAAQRIQQIADQLRAQIRSGAETLGYIPVADTLESLNSQIAALQSSSTMAADAIGSAVDGMRGKMALLLGDLSPFNDQRKLQLALEGLAAGTVDPNQVLEIGRRLYASTANYRALFDQVMAMANFGGRTPGIATDISTNGDGRSLDELIAARDALLAAQRPDIADGVARRIAELAAGTNEDFAAIVEAQGWTLDRLAADLGLSNEKLIEYLTSLRDRFADTTFLDVGQMIANAINVSRDAIVNAIDRNLGDGVSARLTERQVTESREDSRISHRNEEAMLAELQRTTQAIAGLTAAVRDYQPRMASENAR